MTPKEIAEKIVGDKERLERSGDLLTLEILMFAEAYLESLIRCEKLERVTEAAKAVIEFVNSMFCDTDRCLAELREALAELEKSE